MTAMPPSTSPPPSILLNTTLMLVLDLYRQCLEHGARAKVVLEACCDGKHVSFFCKHVVPQTWSTWSPRRTHATANEEEAR